MQTKKTILLVDDDPDVLKGYESALKNSYITRTASSGEACLEESRNNPPDLIVLDVMMDTLSDGLDACKALKENEKTREIPLVMVTSVNNVYNYRTQIDDEYFQKDVWLDKPVKSEKLLEVIDRLIG